MVSLVKMVSLVRMASWVRMVKCILGLNISSFNHNFGCVVDDDNA